MTLVDGLVSVGAICVAWMLYRAQRNTENHFDLFDLIMIDGKLSRVSVAFIVTLCTSTWVIIRLTLSGDLTEGHMGLYMTAWVAPVISKMFAAPAQAGTTTTESSGKTITTIEKDRS